MEFTTNLCKIVADDNLPGLQHLLDDPRGPVALGQEDREEVVDMALCQAAAQGSTEVFRFLSTNDEKGAAAVLDPDNYVVVGAVKGGHLEILEILTSSSFQGVFKCPDSGHPLFVAIQHNRPEVVEWFFGHGVFTREDAVLALQQASRDTLCDAENDAGMLVSSHAA